jgi:hypothetical protein
VEVCPGKRPKTLQAGNSFNDSEVFWFQNRIGPTQRSEVSKPVEGKEISVMSVVRSTRFVVKCSPDDGYHILAIKKPVGILESVKYWIRMM